MFFTSYQDCGLVQTYPNKHTAQYIGRTLVVHWSYIGRTLVVHWSYIGRTLVVQLSEGNDIIYRT